MYSGIEKQLEPGEVWSIIPPEALEKSVKSFDRLYLDPEWGASNAVVTAKHFGKSVLHRLPGSFFSKPDGRELRLNRVSLGEEFSLDIENVGYATWMFRGVLTWQSLFKIGR